MRRSPYTALSTQTVGPPPGGAYLCPAAVLESPDIACGVAESVPATQFFDRDATLGSFQKPQNLGFGVALLLHVRLLA